MLAEIMRIVTEDISGRINQYDVLYEAITNSIQANSTLIKCTLHSNMATLEDDEGSIGRKKLDNITIWDNGDGFSKDNYDSFCKYRTKHKKELGCKGVGRFTFLKVYRNANYVSEVKIDQERKEFKFNLEFDTENIKKISQEISSNSTVIELTSLTSEYINDDRGIDKRIYLDLEEIKEKALLHLIPILFFYKKKGRDIIIEFTDSATDESVSITKDDVPNFAVTNFVVTAKDKLEHRFNLYYQFEEIKGKLNAFYCGNSRTVCEFSDKDFKMKLPKGYSGFLLLESEYLDAHVNNERNDFDIFPLKVDSYSTISWEMINTELKKEISSLVKTIIPETENINREKLKEIEEERPYLVNYIDEEDFDIAGFLDKKAIIDGAKKKFDIAKERVLTNAGKAEYTDRDLHDAIQIAQNELVSYINDRMQVIDRLQKLVDGKEKVEQIIHDLFMQMGTSDDYFSVGKNNLWLIDDRFTTYSYAASDRKIKTTLKSLGENSDDIDNNLEEPDLALFFSHNPNIPGNEDLKSVLIEIKPFDFQSKPEKNKFAGIQQLLNYVEAFQAKERIKEIYAFLITDIDSKLAHMLVRDGYKPLFSTDSPIYHRYYDMTNITIYVVSARTLIRDAEARNKVFLDIIRKQSRLHKMLEETNAKDVD